MRPGPCCAKDRVVHSTQSIKLSADEARGELAQKGADLHRNTWEVGSTDSARLEDKRGGVGNASLMLHRINHPQKRGFEEKFPCVQLFPGRAPPGGLFPSLEEWGAVRKPDPGHGGLLNSAPSCGHILAPGQLWEKTNDLLALPLQADIKSRGLATAPPRLA